MGLGFWVRGRGVFDLGEINGGPSDLIRWLGEAPPDRTRPRQGRATRRGGPLRRPRPRLRPGTQVAVHASRAEPLLLGWAAPASGLSRAARRWAAGWFCRMGQ
jgi:hypothetical protein